MAGIWMIEQMTARVKSKLFLARWKNARQSGKYPAIRMIISRSKANVKANSRFSEISGEDSFDHSLSSSSVAADEPAVLHA